MDNGQVGRYYIFHHDDEYTTRSTPYLAGNVCLLLLYDIRALWELGLDDADPRLTDLSSTSIFEETTVVPFLLSSSA